MIFNSAKPRGSITLRRNKNFLLLTLICGALIATLLMLSPIKLGLFPQLLIVGLVAISMLVFRYTTFMLLIFTTITFYSYFYLGYEFSFAGGSSINLLDVAWLLYFSVSLFASVLPRLNRGNTEAIYCPRFPPELFAMMPYLMTGAVLPALGVMYLDAAPGHAIIGLRYLVWMGLMFLGYSFCRQYGVTRVSRHLITILAIAGVCHAVYGSLQLLISAGLVGNAWLILQPAAPPGFDGLWPTAGRTTGLLTNPNNFGILGAVNLSLAVALFLERYRPTIVVVMLGISGAFAVATSGSRSALLGLAVGLLALIFLYVRRNHSPNFIRSIQLGFLTIFALVIAAAWLPDQLLDRYGAFERILSGGVDAEVNAAGRVSFWVQHWDYMTEQYPLGTWVSPVEQLGLAVDNFYVLTAVQGTPAFTLLLVIFVLAVFSLSARIFSRAAPSACARTHFSLSATTITGVLVGSAMGTGSFHHIYIMTIYSPMLGVLIAGHQQVRSTSKAQPKS